MHEQIQMAKIPDPGDLFFGLLVSETTFYVLRWIDEMTLTPFHKDTDTVDLH